MLLRTLRILCWLLVAIGANLVSSNVFARDFLVGVGLHLGTNWITAAQVTPAIEEAGFTAIRDEVFWHRLEAKSGRLEFPESLRDLDSQVARAPTMGVTPLLILDYGNKRYDDGDLITSGEGRSAYVRYAKSVMEKFGRTVTHYEIWNEWNIGMGSPKKPRTLGSPSSYVDLLRASYGPLKEAQPQSTIIGGVVAGLDDRWIDGFLKAGGLQYVDAFSVHPYVHQGAPNQMPETAIDWLDRLEIKLAGAANGKKFPIYVTEIGWPTSSGRPGVPESVAAAYFARFYLLAAARDSIAGVWWYTLIDSGDDQANKEHRFGLLRRNQSPKPAFITAKYLVPILRSTEISEFPVSRDIRAVVTKPTSGSRSVFVWVQEEGVSDTRQVAMGDVLKAAGISGLTSSDSSRMLTVSGMPVELKLINGSWSPRPLPVQ